MKRILCIGLCLVTGFSAFANEMAIVIEKSTVVDNANLSDAILAGAQDAKLLYDDFVGSYLPIIPPSPSEMFLQPVRRLVVFDEAGFDRHFLSNLVGEMHPVSGAPVYTVYAMMDAANFDVVLFNENLLELARIPRTKTFNPFSWVESRFVDNLTPELMALYNPTRMIAEYKLISIDYADYHIVALERQAALEAVTVSMATALSAESDGVSIRMSVVPASTNLTESEESLLVMAMASSPPPPGGGTNSPPAGSGGGSSNLVMELAITMPLDCGPYAEIFRKQDLVYSQLWSVAVNKMAVTGGVETIWADPASSNAATMFYIVGDTSAGFDDGDGYSELRERHVENSNPFVFDMRDVDGDNMHDWFEIMYFGGSITNQSGTDDFDGDSLANNVEMELHPAAGTNSAYVTFSSDPSLYDTDGDGTDDGTEVSQGSDPLNPADGGQPPATNATTVVTLYLQSANAQAPITMTLSDATNSYALVSSGTEMTSNSHDVVTGRSYTVSLEQTNNVVPLIGSTGYFAGVSGEGVVKVDPMNILGTHTTDLSQGVNTGTVHVLKKELVFVGYGEGITHDQSDVENYLEGLDASFDADESVWVCTNLFINKMFHIGFVDNQSDFIEALETPGAYVAFYGHSNYGAGLAFNDYCNSFNGLVNVGDTSTGIHWETLKSQLPRLLFPLLHITQNPINYDTSCEKERHANWAGTYQGHTVPEVGTTPPTNVFTTVYGTGTNSFHYLNEGNPFLIVDGGQSDMPSTLGYKWLMLATCQSGIYYLDNFNHSTTFYLETDGYEGRPYTKSFVKAVVEGKTENELVTELNGIDPNHATFNYN